MECVSISTAVQRMFKDIDGEWYEAVNGNIRHRSMKDKYGDDVCPIIALAYIRYPRESFTNVATGVARRMGISREEEYAIVTAADFSEAYLRRNCEAPVLDQRIENRRILRRACHIPKEKS